MMIVKNLTRNIIISSNAKICGSIFSKFVGLMFSRKSGRALIFAFKKENKISLHMLFVFYSIDVLFLDKNKKVADIKENFRPFTLYTSRIKSKYAVELPNRTIKKTKTKIGDRIGF